MNSSIWPSNHDKHSCRKLIQFQTFSILIYWPSTCYPNSLSLKIQFAHIYAIYLWDTNLNQSHVTLIFISSGRDNLEMRILSSCWFMNNSGNALKKGFWKIIFVEFLSQIFCSLDRKKTKASSKQRTLQTLKWFTFA